MGRQDFPQPEYISKKYAKIGESLRPFLATRCLLRKPGVLPVVYLWALAGLEF